MSLVCLTMILTHPFSFLQHVNLYWPSEFASTVDNGAFTIAHEMGHLAFGLLDEYSDDFKVTGSDHTGDDPNLS